MSRRISSVRLDMEAKANPQGASKDLDLDDEETFQLVGPGEEDYDNNKILTTSPIGQGLLGKKKGDVADIKVPASFEDPMYMIINLAMGSKVFGGVGFVDAQSPPVVEFQIDRVSAYQIDASDAPDAPNPSEATAAR